MDTLGLDATVDAFPPLGPSGWSRGLPFRFYCSEISFFDQSLIVIILNLQSKYIKFRTGKYFSYRSENGKNPKFRTFRPESASLCETRARWRFKVDDERKNIITLQTVAKQISKLEI